MFQNSTVEQMCVVHVCPTDDPRQIPPSHNPDITLSEIRFVCFGAKNTSATASKKEGRKGKKKQGRQRGSRHTSFESSSSRVQTEANELPELLAEQCRGEFCALFNAAR